MKTGIDRTRILDEAGRPLALYHATPVEGGIKRYRPLSHFGTARAAKMRAAHFVFQALKMPNPAPVPEVPDAQLVTQAGDKLPHLSTQKVYLYMKHPLEMKDLISHNLAQWQYWFSRWYEIKKRFLSVGELREMDALGEDQMNYKRLITHFIFSDPFAQSRDNLIKELSCETLYDVSDVLKNVQHENYPSYLRHLGEKSRQVPFHLAEAVAFQRMIRFFEGEGYDGFKYRNEYEDMGEYSWMNMRSEQVYNPLSDHAITPVPSLSPEQQAFLLHQERCFFEPYGILSPTERIMEHKNLRHKQCRFNPKEYE